jgi:hypothetical protein
MGHADAPMAGIYRQKQMDKPLHKVVDAVHDWLFG